MSAWPFTTVRPRATGLISYQFSDTPKRAATTSDVALPIALDHCSMRFVSAALSRICVVDVPAPVVCFFLGIGASGCESPGKGCSPGPVCRSPRWEGKESRNVVE